MNKKINTKTEAFVSFLIVVLLLILLNRVGYLNQIKNYTSYLLIPIGKTFQHSSNRVNDFFWTIESINKFKKDNLKLKEENLKMNYEILGLNEIAKENKILKSQINFSENGCPQGVNVEWVMADIIGRDSSNFGKHIFINSGENKGIQIGQPVTASGGLLIGKVVEVFDVFSKVMLIIDSKSSVNSITQTSRANGVVKGNYATGIKLEMINQSEELTKGDLIMTSGLEDKIFKGLIIGKILKIEESANNIFKSAEIEMFININKVEKVFIATNIKYD